MQENGMAIVTKPSLRREGENDAPGLRKSDGPLYGDGPIWRMELAVPAVWPDSTAAVRSQK